MLQIQSWMNQVIFSVLFLSMETPKKKDPSQNPSRNGKVVKGLSVLHVSTVLVLSRPFHNVGQHFGMDQSCVGVIPSVLTLRKAFSLGPPSL